MAEPGSKAAERLLIRPAGATMDELIAATGGPQYNVLRRLEARGYAVRKLREGRVTRYSRVGARKAIRRTHRESEGTSHVASGVSRASGRKGGRRFALHAGRGRPRLCRSAQDESSGAIRHSRQAETRFHSGRDRRGHRERDWPSDSSMRSGATNDRHRHERIDPELLQSTTAVRQKELAGSLRKNAPSKTPASSIPWSLQKRHGLFRPFTLSTSGIFRA